MGNALRRVMRAGEGIGGLLRLALCAPIELGANVTPPITTLTTLTGFA